MSIERLFSNQPEGTMKILVCLLFVVTMIVLPAAVFEAAPAPQKSAPVTSLLDTFGWLPGNWEGEGVQSGSAFTSYLDVNPLLDGTVIQIKRASSSGLKEMMLVGFDGSAKKYVGVLYDSRNQIGLYSCEVQNKNIAFVQIGLPQGYSFRRTFALQPDGSIHFAIQRAEPGKEAQSVEIDFKKK
jgi:hypothetical protein